MDKIYSRRRITFFYSDSKKRRKKIKLLLILLIAILTVIIIIKSFDPIYEKLCIEKAMIIATEVTNIETAKVLEQYEYSDIVSITKNEENGTNILKTDVAIINEIASKSAIKMMESLKEKQEEILEIPLGAISGNKYLSGFGPNIKIKIVPSGTVTTDFKTEFEAQGINQTIYRIYMEIKCNVNILNAYRVLETTLTNKVLLVETVIVGGVPETYYNLEGISEENSIDIIE